METKERQVSLIQTNVDWKYVKTFATEANLMKRIEQERETYPEFDDRFMVIRTPEGRWTAIVQLDRSRGGYIGRYEFLKV